MKKKKRIILSIIMLILSCVAGYLLFLRTRYHRIIAVGSDIVHCPRKAREGENVTVKTVYVSDGVLCLYVDDMEIATEQEGIYHFVMPGHDVSVKTMIISTYSNDIVDGPIYFEIKTPIKARYERLWEYSDSAETEDPETIGEIVDALKVIHIGSDPVDQAVDDDTDRIVLTYEDGSESRFVFEADNYVSDLDGGRYPVLQGLEELRSILDRMIESKEN